MRYLAITAMLLMLPVSGATQVLAPPSLPGQRQLTEQLIRSIETKNLDLYSSLLSNDLTVFQDGDKIASNKAEWLKLFGNKLSAGGVYFKLSPGFSATGHLLFIEYFNSSTSWGTEVPQHCCWSYDAVSYDITSNKITVIRRLRGGDAIIKEGSSLPR